jgi:hypothetical protein
MAEQIAETSIMHLPLSSITIWRYCEEKEKSVSQQYRCKEVFVCLSL